VIQIFSGSIVLRSLRRISVLHCSPAWSIFTRIPKYDYKSPLPKDQGKTNEKMIYVKKICVHFFLRAGRREKGARILVRAGGPALSISNN